jgi:drug/metabolite transporter (DMT)-like permease
MALSPRATGTALCILSASSYGCAAIFGKLAYGEGLSIATLLSGRFVVAAAVLWALTLALGGAVRPSRRGVAAGVALGLVVYSAQSGLYFGSLERLDASMTALLVYAFPAFVVVGAVLVGRERLRARPLLALTVSSAGTVLVLAGGGLGGIDGVGAAMALSCAVVYAVYVIVSDAVVRRVHPIPLSAAVCTGCAISFTTAAAVTGELPTDVGGTGWALIVSLALVSTVVSITALAAGTARVGPSSAAMLSTFEPVVTTALAYVVFDERLGGVQVLGGLLVVASVAVLNARLRRRAPMPPPAPAEPERAPG